MLCNSFMILNRACFLGPWWAILIKIQVNLSLLSPFPIIPALPWRFPILVGNALFPGMDRFFIMSASYMSIFIDKDKVHVFFKLCKPGTSEITISYPEKLVFPKLLNRTLHVKKA